MRILVKKRNTLLFYLYYITKIYGCQYIGAKRNNHAEGVYIIKAKPCISSERNALYIIIATAKYSLRLMIYTFGDEIHANA